MTIRNKQKLTTLLIFVLLLFFIIGFYLVKDKNTNQKNVSENVNQVPLLIVPEKIWGKTESDDNLAGIDLEADRSISVGLKLWEREDKYYGGYFLPSYADFNMCYYDYDESRGSLYINDVFVGSGVCMCDLDIDWIPDIFYRLRYDVGKQTLYDVDVRFLHSANMPSMFIYTNRGNMDFVHENKENRDFAYMELVDKNGKLDFQGSLDYIKGHGNTTWGNPKNPYQITLLSEQSLLGMDPCSKYILFANYFDPTLMKNKLSYELAKNAGMPYTSDIENVDLYLNNEYVGNYQIAEKIEIGEYQVDIHDLQFDNTMNNSKDVHFFEQIELESDEESDKSEIKYIDGIINPCDITGGYLIERNQPIKYKDKPSGFATTTGEFFVVRSPMYASKEEVEYIQSIVQSVENAILSPDGVDFVTGQGLWDLIDIDSFADKYIFEELSENEASGCTSSWFYKPEDAVSHKLFAGPVWDYDKAWGSVLDNPRALGKMHCYPIDDEQTEWWYALLKRDEFKEKISERYRERFVPALVKLIGEDLDKYQMEFSQAAWLDSIRWDRADEFDSNVNRLRDWINKRCIFLNEAWIYNTDYVTVKWLDEDGSQIDMVSLPQGERLLWEAENSELLGSVHIDDLDDEIEAEETYKYSDAFGIRQMYDFENQQIRIWKRIDTEELIDVDSVIDEDITLVEVKRN